MTYSCEEEAVDITGCWTNAFEEGADIYKGCNVQAFAAARFRQVYEFAANGTVSYRVLLPNDGHAEIEANWTYDSKRMEVSIFSNDTAELLKKLRVAKIDQRTLSLQEL